MKILSLNQHSFVLSFLLITLFFSFSSCHDDDEQAEYIEYTIAGHKALVSYSLLDLPSYILTDKNGVVSHALDIKGIEDLYEYGNQYKVVLKRTVIDYKKFSDPFDTYHYELIEFISSQKEDESTQYLNYTIDSMKHLWSYEDKTIECYKITDEHGYTEQPISIKGFDEVYEEGRTYTVRLKRSIWKEGPYSYTFNYYAFELVDVIDVK